MNHSMYNHTPTTHRKAALSDKIHHSPDSVEEEEGVSSLSDELEVAIERTVIVSVVIIW